MKKKLFAKICLCIVVLMLACVCKVMWRVYREMPRVSSIYDFGSDIKDVFIGSSQIGCGICEGSNYHNKVIWMSSAGPQFALMNLRELERRGRLKFVSRVVVPFNICNYAHLKVDNIGMGVARSFPVSWRYLRDFPLTDLQMIGAIVKYRHQAFSIGEIAPDRPSIQTRSQEWVDEMPQREGWDKSIFNSRMYTDHLFWCEDWHHALESPYIQMRDICNKKSIELFVLLPPLPSFCKKKLPTVAVEMYNDFVAQLRNRSFNVIDARESMPDEYFADFWHLTKKGSEVFTNRLYREYLNRTK